MSALAYVDNETLNVEPVELICLLYAKAIEKLNHGKDCFRAGRTREGNEAIAFAMEIIVELQGALSEEGGEIATNLADLYDYVQNRLIEALGRTQTAPVDEAVRLLSILLEGWKEVRPAAVIPNGALLPEREAADALTRRAWSV